MRIKELLKLHLKFEGQTSYMDALELYDAILDTPPGDVVEVGSACGGTTIVMMYAAGEVGKMVYSVDPYPEEFENRAEFYTGELMGIFKQKFKENILNGQYNNIVQFNENVKDCIDKLPAQLSVVFIDGCHEYSFVKEEFNLLWPRLVPGGIVFIHDVESSVGQLSNDLDQGVDQVLKWNLGEKISLTMLQIVK